VLRRPYILSRYGARGLLPSARFTSTKSENIAMNSSSVSFEMEQARKEARPYRIDKAKLTAAEREELRRRSRAIPLVADKEPLEVVHEDDDYLVVNKPSFLKMHPSHRFQGGSLLNRAIGHCGYTPKLLHRLDMVR